MSKQPDHVVVDVNGVGYGVDVPRSTSSVLGMEGGQAELFVHFHVSEQAMRLFGFATPQEREIFEVFIGISGIGPKTALGILSSIEAGAFALAVVREDYSTLTKLPGLAGTTFKPDKLPSWPEYFKSFAVAADGTAYGATSAFRVIRVKPDGGFDKGFPAY